MIVESIDQLLCRIEQMEKSANKKQNLPRPNEMLMTADS